MSATARSSAPIGSELFLTEANCHVADLAAVVAETTDVSDYSGAEGVSGNILVYDSERLRGAIATATGRREAQAELARALMDGPGVVVFKRAFSDASVVDAATDAFDAIIADQRATGAASGDHFAKPGANDRVWNALEKLAIRAPSVFAAYYANDIPRARVRRLARARLPDHLSGQRGQPGR